MSIGVKQLLYTVTSSFFYIQKYSPSIIQYDYLSISNLQGKLTDDT